MTTPSPQNKKSIEQQLEYQKKLNNITQKIHSATDTNDIPLNLQDEILGLFEADRITVYLVDSVNKEIVSKFKSGDEINEIRVSMTNGSIAGYCARTGRALNIKDVYDDDEIKKILPTLKFDKTWDQKTGYKTTQMLVAPIAYEKYLLGVIQLINKQTGNRFTHEDQSSILNIAQVLGLALLKNQKASQGAKHAKFDYLVTGSILSNKDLSKAMIKARKEKKSVESVLMFDYDVSKEDIGKSLSDFYKARFIPFNDNMPIPEQLIQGLKTSFLENNVFVPVVQAGNKVLVAMENPNFLPARDAVKRIIPAKGIEFCVSLRDDIFKMIALFFGIKTPAKPGTIENILGQMETEMETEEEDTDSELKMEGVVTEEDSVVVQLVNKMVLDAHARDASDIHFEPYQGKENSVIRFRIDGACQVYQSIPYTYKQAVISRLKIMSDLDIAEKRLPQDGKIKFKKYGPLDIELRVATIPTAGRNEDVVMRLLPEGAPIPLEKIGMSKRNYDSFADMISKPYGIVLVVGPTGSGKTTTLHAALHHINKPETKIWTAEDPVEITQKGLRQVQVQPKIGFDFATAMRSFLRADPDVIMVGEMRDHETVSIGIEASLTGHLVFSTLHTNSAPETITRLLDMGMDTFNFADALIGVLAMRLVRTLCKDCKETYHPSREEYDRLVRAYNGNFDALGLEYNEDFSLCKAMGCPKCGKTGYKGRTGIHELLAGTDDIKSLIQNRAKMEDIRGQAIKDGMTTLLQDGIRKVCLGMTDLVQVRRVCIK